ncbi:MAG: hypothetical protein FJ253_09085 [Phycisphaerae bacterium]|nr:hypothetical protein [Phycisphaerae bacterium]
MSVTPYLWAAGIDATVSNKGITQSFDVGFSDLVQDLEFALMIHLEADIAASSSSATTSICISAPRRTSTSRC